MMSASILTAQRIDVATAELAEGSPEAYAIQFVRTAHAGDLEKAKSMVSDAFLELHRMGGGDEGLIEPYMTADLEKLFQYRMSVPVSDEFPNECAIEIRYFSTTKGRKTSRGFSLKKTDGSWLIVRDSERDGK
jgi:hypothetical protein